jgi:uncharacterized membrane protein
MTPSVEKALIRWKQAGLLRDETVERIRAWEASQPVRNLRWPVWVALGFGVIAVAAGILVFVSSQWDELSPLGRVYLVVAVMCGLHAAGAVVRSPALSTALHALGTITLGGAIQVTAEAFYLDGDWQRAVLLWTAGAIIGWVVLHQWPQAALAAVLTPLWLAGEWVSFVEHRQMQLTPVPLVLLLGTLFAYYTIASPAAGPPERRSLYWIGALTLFPMILITAVMRTTPTLPLPGTGLLAAGWVLALGLPLGLSYLLDSRSLAVSAGWLAWASVLGLVAEQRWTLALHGLCALGAVAMVAWGVRKGRADGINFGIAGFALTVILFSFSSLLDRFGRSLSLIVLGAVFLAGGWQLERFRRRLVAQVRT